MRDAQHDGINLVRLTRRLARVAPLALVGLSLAALLAGARGRSRRCAVPRRRTLKPGGDAE